MAALQLLFFPFVHSQLDAESFGLVGLYLLWLPLLSVLDCGLGLSVTRHLAQAHEDSPFARMVELSYWLSTLAMVFVGCGGAWLLSPLWIHCGSLPTAQVQLAAALVAASIALQWPNAFYSGALFGLGRHLTYNTLNGIFWTIRCAVGAWILWSSHDAISFLAWQALIVFLQNLAFSWALWRCLPGPRGRASLSGLGQFLHHVGPTGAGIFLIMLYNQADKVIASRTLSLAQMGSYGLAWQLVSGLYLLQSPVYSTYSPRLSRALGSPELARDFERSCGLMMGLAGSAALTCLMFAPQLMLLWTGDQALTEETTPLLRVLFGGAFLSCISYMPLTLQQLAGSWRTIARAYIPATLIAVPACWILFPRLGPLAGGVIWAGLNLLMTPILVHGAGALVKLSWPRWWLVTIALPCLACLIWLALLGAWAPPVAPVVLLMLAGAGALGAAGVCRWWSHA